MNWQLLAVGVIVAAAVSYLARQTWRTWSAKKSGCGGCGCGSKSNDNATVIPVEQLTLRRRLDRDDTTSLR